MKFSLAALALVASANALSEEGSNFLLAERFESFKIAHSKVYESVDVERDAMATFEANVEKIAAKNAKLTANGEAPVHGITKVGIRVALGLKIGCSRPRFSLSTRTFMP